LGCLLAISHASFAQELQIQPAAGEPPAGSSDVDAEHLPAPNAVPPSADAPSPAVAVKLRTALERPGNLTLNEVQLRAALFMISQQWQINVVAGDVQGSVNGVFRDAPLREILDAILLSNGYNYRAVGESLVISSVKDLGQINPFFQSATIPVRSADIDEVVQGARLLTTPQGQVQAIKSARSIVVLDFPDRVQMIHDFVTSIDHATQTNLGGGVRSGQPIEVAYFRTHYISAKAAEDALQAVLSKDGRVGVMEREDRLLVSDYAENLLMVEKALQQIDRPRPQVQITALIYDISLQDVEELGFNWNELTYHTGDDTVLSIGIDPVTKNPLPLQPVNASGATIAIGLLSRHFNVLDVINALNAANDARLLADPHVSVLDNEEATFQSISEIPYQQLTQTAAGGQIGTTAFRDAGITLRVRPKIAADGTILMEVTPEFSRLVGFTPGDNQPIIDRRTATTMLRVANRQTVVIGGLRQRQEIGEFSGIPFLKDMRVVGKLFRSRETTVRESELVVFINPEVIGTADPLNRREQLVVDTVGCRLNQVTEAEGCPPPCCDVPAVAPLRLPPPDDCGSETLPDMAGATDLPAGAVYPYFPAEANRGKPTTNDAAPFTPIGGDSSSGDEESPNQRTPAYTPVSGTPQQLFAAPPTPTQSQSPNEYDTRYRSGGALQFGYPAIGTRPSPHPARR
jgi:general secretion pathway protein D